MSPSDRERRYSDEEFALILRAASEVEEGPASAPVPAPPRDGLTLAEIQEIAGEVGIDPLRISSAAALLPQAESDPLIRLIGGHPRHRLEHSVKGEVSAGELSRIIDVARRTLDVQGDAREVMGAVEWKAITSASTVRVSLTPREGETAIQTSVDRTESILGIYGGVGVPLGGIIGLALGKLVFGETDAGIVAAIISGFTPSLLFARTLWKRSTKKWRERLFQLMDALAREAQDAATRTGHEEREGEGADT